MINMIMKKQITVTNTNKSATYGTLGNSVNIWDQPKWRNEFT